MFVASLLVVSLLAAVVQAPSPLPATAQELADLLRKTHGKLPDEGVHAFAGRIQLDPIQHDEHAVSIVLDVKFKAPNLIRYKVEEAERPLERGKDDISEWMRDGERVTRLTSMDFATDRKEVRKHLQLAKIYTRFLDPAEIVRALQAPAAVQEDKLSLGRALQKLPTLTIEGRVDAFPMYDGETCPARLRLWVDRATHRLVAVRAIAVDDKGKPTGIGEVVAIDGKDYVERQGLLLPTQLVVYGLENGDDKNLLPRVKVQLPTIELNPALDKQDFRPGK